MPPISRHIPTFSLLFDKTTLQARWGSLSCRCTTFSWIEAGCELNGEKSPRRRPFRDCETVSFWRKTRFDSQILGIDIGIE